MMYTVFFFYMPIVFYGSYKYIHKHNIDYRLLLLTQIHNMMYIYNIIQTNLQNIFLTWYKRSYDDFIIENINIYKPFDINLLNDITYYYKESKYKIIYDNNYLSSTTLQKGNVVDISINKNIHNIVIIEIVNTDTDETKMVSDILAEYITQYAGPNQDFYNFEKQPIYLHATHLNEYIQDKTIIQNISKYIFHITYMNMEIIAKKINII